MGIKMKEKMICIQKMLAKKGVRRFLGITLLLFLVGLPGLYLLRSVVFNLFTVKRILLAARTDVFNSFIVQAALIGITAVLLVIWVFNTGWYSVWYRYMVLRAAKVAGFLVRKSRTYMERIILYMIILGLIIAAWQWLLPEALPVPKFLAWLTFDLLLKILVVFVIMKISQMYLKLKKQIVFQKFKNLTGETSFDVPVEAIQEVLINRFNYLKELIYTIDEINPKSYAQTGSPSINVSDAVDSLKSLELPGQKIKFASFVEVPLDFIVSALINILKGPILTGSLHKRGNDLELIARMSGRRFSGNWRVNIGDLDEEEKKLPEKDRLEKMIEHLCCMIFTRLVSVGSDRWKAVHRYTEGLRDYRQASKKEKGKNIHLRQAEKAFIDAKNEDNTFFWCHYNLGVVYEELGQDDSAEVAFREVLKINHENADACFNLGIIYFNKGKLQDALWYAGQAIRLKPGDALYWNLHGIVCENLYIDVDDEGEETGSDGSENDITPSPGDENKNIEIVIFKEQISSYKKQGLISFHIAVKLSWQALCGSICRGIKDNKKLEDIASACLTNLALAHHDDDKNRKIRLFNQTIDISSGEGRSYFELGIVFCSLDNWEKALLAFDKVFEEDSTLSNSNSDSKSIAFWALYVYACKKLISQGKTGDYETRCSNAKYHLLDAISGRLEEFFTSDQDIQTEFNDWVYKKLKEELENELEPKLRDEIDKWVKDGELWPKDESEYEDWSSVQIDIFLAKKEAKDEIPYECIKRLKGVLDKLEDNHEREIRTHRLYGLLAECYLKSYKSREREKREETIQKALYYAKKAVEIDPFSAEDRGLLSRVYFKLNDYDQAFKELKNFLLLTPADLDILRYIPIIRNWDRVFFYDPERRKENFKSLCEFLEEGLRQMKAMVFNDQAAMDSFEYMNTIYYKLGSFHRKLKNYDDAIDYLKIAGTMGGRDALKAKLELGWTYMEAMAYNKAEQVFAEIYRYNENYYPIEVLLGLAAAIIERTISANGVNELLDYPREILDDVKERLVESENNTRLKTTIKRELPRYWARYYGCMGRIAIKKEEIEDAVNHFEKSVSIEGSSWGYYFLAEAYYRRSQEKKEIKKGKERCYLERAQDACIMSENFDKKDLYNREVTALKQKITGDIERLKTQENTRKGGK
jgi:tetratricopeptide (TPR) repeat protein